MKAYLPDLIKELYDNVKRQIELSNEVQDYRKGSVIIKRRYNVDYYYLSYRKDSKVVTDYLGKISKQEVNKIKQEIQQGLRIKKQIKDLECKEKELRKIIKGINKEALVKDIYNVVDIIIITKPIFKKFGIKEAYLYGSYSEGNPDRNSDINFEIDKTKKSLKELIIKLQNETHKEVDVITFATKLPENIRETIEEQKILIYTNY